MASGAVLAQVATIVAMPLLSRLYSPQAFGQFALFVSGAAILFVFATLRYELAVVLPRSSREAAAIKQLGVRLLIAISLTMTLVGVTIALSWHTLEPETRWLVALVGPEVFLLGYLSFQNFWFTREKRFSVLSRNRVLQALTTVGVQAGVGFTAMSNGVGLALGLLAGQVVAVGVLALGDTSRAIAVKLRGQHRWSYLLRKHWRQPVLNGPHALMDSIRLNGINLVIGQISVQALGQYSQAWRLAQAPSSLIASAVSQVFFPLLAEAPKRELPRLVRKSIGASLALGFVPFALVFWLSPTLFPFVLGAEWGDAGFYARALAPWLYLSLATSPISTMFIVLNKQGLGLIITTVQTIVPIVLLWLLRGDLMVAITVMSLSQAASLVILAIVVHWLAVNASKGIPSTVKSTK